MLGKSHSALAAVLAWLIMAPGFSAYAVSDPPENFLVAITNMMSLPNLAYEKIELNRHHSESSSYVEWKRQDGKTFYRMRPNETDFLKKETVYLYDGAAHYMLFGDVALKEDSEKPGFPGMPGVKYLAAAQSALPVPDEFQGVPCWRYEWPCETMITRITGGTIAADLQSVIRNDFIDQATGWWIGYTLTNSEGAFEGSTRLDLISTNELPDDLFATPKPPIRIRPHTTEIFQEETIKRMTALGLMKKAEADPSDGGVLVEMLSQRYHLPLNRILFCAGVGAVTGLLVSLFIALRRKKKA